MTADSPVILGIRHHGPGSARAVRRALEEYQPEIVLIEGPPEADPLVALAASPELRPPVALLAYPADKTADKTADRTDDGGKRAAFWPFAEFSPEWQAITWAVGAGVPVQFCDLPAAHRFAAEQDEPTGSAPAGESDVDRFRHDPIGALAEAAGYGDPERWWEDLVEHRLPGGDSAMAPFEAIAEAMTEVRAHAPAPPEAERLEEERREASMRTVLRAALKQHARVAVVCGAWHVPALTAPLPTASADAAILRGLPKGKIAMTWVPWTHGRLASWQGYGAGVTSPGWYHHLFTAVDRPVTRWLVKVAGVLRDEDQPVSSAHVIEAVRLAEALATLRGRPLAGLAEVTEATRGVLCDGDDLRLELVNRRLVVGEELGAVPADTPSVPLVADVVAARKRLRLPPKALEETVRFDLRKELDLGRSQLLHRLRLLDVEWGVPVDDDRGKGTFWESWRLQWRPEFEVDLIDASGYGTTVVSAATARTVERAAQAKSLADVTALVERCLLADLPHAFTDVLRALDDRVALDVDTAHLMAAVPALARTLRYGDVRGTDVGALRVVVTGMVRRVCVGLPAAVTALDDDAAMQMRGHIDGVQVALSLLDDPALTEGWLTVLDRLATRDDLHGVLAGRLNRLLFDAHRVAQEEVGRRMGLVLTIGVPPARAAAWIEGFVAGGGLLLVHDARLLALVDGWLAAIGPDMFIEVLPLLRRTFSSFAAPERRAIGERVRTLDTTTPAGEHGDADGLDDARAALVLPTLEMLLGRELQEIA